MCAWLALPVTFLSCRLFDFLPLSLFVSSWCGSDGIVVVRMCKDQLAVGLEFPVFIRTPVKVTATLVISFFFFPPALVTAASDFAHPHITTAYLCFIVFSFLVSHSGSSHSLCICSHFACTVTYFLYYEHCLCKTNACSGCFVFFLFFCNISRSVFVFVLFFVLTLLDGTCLHNQWSCKSRANF